jgi:hypothetical protein
MSASDPRAAPNPKILLALPGASTHVPIDMVDKRERQPSKNSFGLIAQWEESGNSPQPGTRLNYGINQLYQADPDNAALARTTVPEYCAFP